MALTADVLTDYVVAELDAGRHVPFAFADAITPHECAQFFTVILCNDRSQVICT